ncbi:MAG: alpha-mannosidase [Clostridia bacterium]|nr:alpha-mannosidase [Clostridia bacterium]
MHYQSFNNRMLSKLNNLIWQYARYIYDPVQVYRELPGYETVEHFRRAPKAEYTTYREGDKWGGEYGNLWLKFSYTVPEKLAGQELYVLQNAELREGLLFVNGKPAGMFGTIQREFEGLQHNIRLTSGAAAGETFDLELECYAWHNEPSVDPYSGHGGGDFRHTFHNVSICTLNREIKDFVLDLRILLSMTKIGQNPFLQSKAVNILERVFSTVVLHPANFDFDVVMDSVRHSNAILSEIYTGNMCKNTYGRVGIIGHSHMDTAWMWPIAETMRKCARTFSNALALMEQYADYKFIQSSVLHTYWMEKLYPAIYEDIQKRVADNRFEINGGAWVECDCNITGGEYMIRQFLKGQTYLREKFGMQSDSFWLPDTFGYNAAIPQIMRGCGMKYFYTTKLGWNEHNKFPFETFRWIGIDGSEVITHFNVTHCEPAPHLLTEHVGILQNKNADDSRLVAFGYGDGGGGPTDVMVEEATRVARINGLPQVEYTTISEFGRRLEENREQLPVYNGELYLELHRGTLTQRHQTKRNNRLAENALRNMELMTVMTGADYAAEKYDEYVKVLLENQFHDILPGTSLQCVHDKSEQVIGELIVQVDGETQRLTATATAGNEAITFVNPLSFDRQDVIYMDDNGRYVKGLANQPVEDVFGRRKIAVAGVALDAFEARSLPLTDTYDAGTSPFTYDGRHLDTPYAAIDFDDNGYIASFVDKTSGRQLRREGGAPLGTLYMGEDIPVHWDNWDVEYDQKFKMVAQTGFTGREVVSDGSVQMRLRSTYKIGQYSELVQDMIVYANSPRVDFHTKVDWKDTHHLLKVSFDVDVLTTRAKHEIQFGHIDRTTTENDPVETARFEVCNHKWTDLSESRFGVALLNDCKYGISVRGSDMQLSLHRGGSHPDPSGDIGVHEMTYALLPHTGAFNTQNVVRPAYELNMPSIIASGALNKVLNAPVYVDADNILCEAVKPAECIENAYVVRLYEAERNRTVTDLHFPAEVKKVCLANMLEDPAEELALTDGTCQITFKPFEIKTLICYQ